MNICVLGWGSLIWNPGILKISGKWNNDGPNFPIEFARVSGNGRLTLVIKEDFDNVKLLWATSPFQTLDSARNNLMLREDTNIDNIGYFNFCNHSYSIRRCGSQLSDELISWNEDKNFDAVIWTDIGPNFSKVSGKKFLVENIILYLEELSKNETAFTLAKNYILNTPDQVQTRFRKKIENFLATK